MKNLIALAFLTGSLAAYGGTYYDDTSRVDDSNRTSVEADDASSSAYSDEYEDTSSTRASSTARDSEYDEDYTSTRASATARDDQKVVGQMPDFSREGMTAQKWHAGIMTGISNPRQGLDTEPSFGLDIGYQPTDNIGAGVEAFTAKQDDGGDNQRTTALLKSTFHLGGDMPVLNTAFLGAGIGPVFIDNKIRWAAAPMAGFDVPLSTKTNDFISLGLNARYVFTTDDDGATPNEFMSALALKYWF